MEKYGFVYLWFDKKHKRFYIGCHWGHENDGYICSSKWMSDSYKRRPQDFKRRIVEKVNTIRSDLLVAENKWLTLIKDVELGKRYYNLTKHHNGHWTTSNDEYKKLDIKQRISTKTKEAMHRPEVRAKVEVFYKSLRVSTQTQEVVEKRSVANRGQKRTTEFKERVSQQKRGNTYWLGKNHSKETVQKLTGENNHFYGKSHSEESRLKISQASKGKKRPPRTEEHCKKISENKKKYWEERAKC